LRNVHKCFDHVYGLHAQVHKGRGLGLVNI
jgi:hypothetical protein